MKKILFFIPNLLGGGAEKVLVNLANNLDKQKYHITVMTIFDVGENKKYLNSHIEYKTLFPKIIRGNIYLFKLFSPQFLCKRIVKEDYDIIVSYLQSPATRIISGYKGKAKIVNWVHNEYHDEEQMLKVYRNHDELVQCYNNYDATVFVSLTALEAFKNLFNGEINCSMCVLYNTVEDEKIRSMAMQEIEDIHFDENKINLISVGRFVEQKAFDRLIRVVAKLIKDDGIDIDLYFLGKGPLEASYRNLINDLNIGGSVHLLGYKDNPYKYVKKCDLFVCSSLFEGFSTAVTEALIVGTPVITTDCSGMKELLGENNEYGIIVNNDEGALYDGLKELLKNETEIQKLAEKAVNRGAKFNKTKTIQETEYFFDELLKRRK